MDEATRPVLAWIAAIDGEGGLDAYPGHLARMAQRLVQAGLSAAAVSHALAAANDALTGRLLRRSETRLGPPPSPYAWLSLGSAGRREEALHSDQDNALVYQDIAGADTAYFAALAELTVSGLAEAGLPRCPGGYVATRWRHPLPQWERMFRRWIDQPDPQGLIEAELLLDFRRVHGDLSPAPLDRIMRTGAGRPRLAVQMARAAVLFTPPLRPFGRIRARHGHVDVKRAGIAAIVLLARLYALAAGSVVRPTVLRLAAAAEGGTLSGSGAEELTDAYRFLTDLRLRAQIRKIAAGEPPDNRVQLADLSEAEQRRLRDALRCVRDIQEITARKYHTETVS